VPGFSKRSSPFGVVLPQGWREDLDHIDGATAQFDAMLAVGREADRLGFDSVWLYDHLQPPPTFECWTSLAAIARETDQVRLGQIVTCALYRNAGLLARIAQTLDAASGRRCLLGLGAGWDEAEYRDHGYPEPWPGIGERLRILDETAGVLRARVPGIPLMIGGHGERVLLRLVARHADACNFTDSTDPAFYRGKIEILRRHCDEVGRDESTILRTATLGIAFGEARQPITFAGSAAELVEVLGGIFAAGIDYVIPYFQDAVELEPLRIFAADVAPAFRP
jgi:alkanesulfonate monooxygenase SsuD/methylene tetrahydromethanopterin reductase-like flavin-dependent oxidoreductase (luciferase family)